MVFAALVYERTFIGMGVAKNDKLRHIQNRPSTCTGECNSHVRRRFADKHTKMTTKMYGANLRQTSKNAKTLESGIHFWAVLKLWMAKTFEKISLFVKTISAKILMYGRSHRYSRWKNVKNARKTKGEDSREYVLPYIIFRHRFWWAYHGNKLIQSQRISVQRIHRWTICMSIAWRTCQHVRSAYKSKGIPGPRFWVPESTRPPWERAYGLTARRK